ncbi:MAG: hypothetical protein HW380_1391 [Magnetococcales bacterium]|nr:hypothetical protein [Magnetococcales bacterium]
MTPEFKFKFLLLLFFLQGERVSSRTVGTIGISG